MAFMIGTEYWWMGMDANHYSMMGFFSLDSGIMYLMAVFGATCGIVIMTGSSMLKRRPQASPTWGTAILIFSLLSLVDMEAFLWEQCWT